MKLCALAGLVFAGLILILLAFVPSSAPAGTGPSPTKLFMWGLLCLFAVGVWAYWDYKKRILTPDEEVEKLLMDVSKRFRHTRSLEAVIEEYRARGATDDTISIIQNAPNMLKRRVEAKLILGIQLLVTGLIVAVISHFMVRLIGRNEYWLAVGPMGAGAGFILQGLLQKRAFRQ